MAELRAMRDRDETQTRKDAPVYELDEAFWDNARLVMPEKLTKTHTGLRIDDEVLSWFKQQGKGWQTRMNGVLRAYVIAQQSQQKRSDL